MKKKFIVESKKHPYAAWAFKDIPDCEDAELEEGDEVIIKQLRIKFDNNWNFEWVTDFKYHATHDPELPIDEIIEVVQAPSDDSVCFLFPDIEIVADFTEEQIKAIEEFGIELQFGYTQDVVDGDDDLKYFEFFDDSKDYSHDIDLINIEE